MKTSLRLAALLALLPLAASAHIGADAGLHHGSAFLVGFTHPFTGLDHLAAMITVGLWSALSFPQSAPHGRRNMFAVPLAFAALLLIGGLLGFAGLSLPLLEPMIAASVLVLGVLVAARLRLPLAASMGLVGVFALFHGVAHGGELPASHAVASLTGMVLGTLILHLAGMALGLAIIQRNVWLPRLAGGIVALTGLGLLSGAL